MIECGDEISGSLLTDDDAPLAGWQVTLWGHSIRLDATTDDQGQFAFCNCGQPRYRLTARAGNGAIGTYPSVWLDEVTPGRDLVVRVPRNRMASAFIQGTLVAPDARPIAGADIDVTQIATGTSLSLFGSPFFTGTDGRFRAGPLPPATYRVTMKAAGYADLVMGDFEVEVEQLLDLSIITIPTVGTLVAVAARSDGLPLADLRMSVSDARGDKSNVNVTANVGHSMPLAPGSYVLVCRAKRTATSRTPFVIAADRETHVEVTLAPGVTRYFRCVPPPGAQPYEWVHIIVRDAQANVVADDRSGPEMTPTFTLATGRFTIEAETSTGLRARETVEVAEIALDAEDARRIDLLTDPRVVQVTLR